MNNDGIALLHLLICLNSIEFHQALYETSIKSEPQNRRISNVEVWFRFAQSLNKIDRMPYFDIRNSVFDIRYSLFQSFFLDQTGRLRPEAPLV